MPVEFPQTVWLNVNVGSGSKRWLKIGHRILYLYPTTRSDHLLLLGHVEYKWIWNSTIRGHFGLFVGVTLLGRRNRAPENEGILGGKVLEVGDVETKVLSDNFKRGMNEPVGKHERGPSSVEVTVGEQQQDVEAIVQCLYTVRNALGESGEKLSQHRKKPSILQLTQRYLAQNRCGDP